MNKITRNTLIVIAILVLAGGVFFAGNLYARATAYGFTGMMGGYRSNTGSNDGYGPGMMGGSRAGSGMMGGQGGYGMMGGYGSNSASVTPLTLDEAKVAAGSYLDANLAGATAATDPVQFYGYYTLDFERDGVVAGMLSVNGYSGQVFLHTWHGTFIEEQVY